MTYMYEYPQFVKISVANSKEYPQYGLYSYSEGRQTERARKMWFDGIPLLFLPGNVGSHKQVRSIASVALRKALSYEYEYHFDFFTVSFNEEISGLYGGVLGRQTEYVSLCLHSILNLYKKNRYLHTVPNAVILIGHSMGGLIAKRLLAYPDTFNMTNIAITLAAPLHSPVINFDSALNEYYMNIQNEWNSKRNYITLKENKVLLSFGGGPRDVLIPSGLSGSEHSDLNALTTAIPGVWVSTDHVSIVWCKQLVLVLNKYLFSIVDPYINQIVEDKEVLVRKAEIYFKANRSLTLNPEIKRHNVTMTSNGFWYEDNRRVYQVSRPNIEKITYLMIRLVSFPQNRFVAVESINLDDKDWVFGCSAKYSADTHRYCTTATSLSELSRWTGSATLDKRKLATINLHKIMEIEPDWTHIVIKVSPTRKPITLNIDINDFASRQIVVDAPVIPFDATVIKLETEPNALYYELLLPDMYLVHQVHLLHIEPTQNCRATQYHVSAEMHIPWAENHDNYHYFTHLKKSPMKLRIYKSNPNVTNGLTPSEPVKVTILLDPQCTFTISITQSYYHYLSQLVRHYCPILLPYTAAVILLAARNNIMKLKEHGGCISMHNSLASDELKPYYILVFTRLGTVLAGSIPILAYLLENANTKNQDLRYFTQSLLSVPLYLTALGLVNVMVAVVLATMVFFSQLANRMLFRIVWRGGSNVAEKLASVLQKVPMLVSAALACATPVSCGAASLVAGTAFYGFMLSKMYEEYLEDYAYKMMAKYLAKFHCFFNRKESHTDSSLVVSKTDTDKNTPDKLVDKTEQKTDAIGGTDDSKVQVITNNEQSALVSTETPSDVKRPDEVPLQTNCKTSEKVDKNLSALNFHVMLFYFWFLVTLVNVPALLTWTHNFKYSIVLKSDTSYYPGIIMSVCAGFLWQMQGPRENLRYYQTVSKILFVLALVLMVLGPFLIYYISYVVTFAYALITVQQLFDKEIPQEETHNPAAPDQNNQDSSERANISNDSEIPNENLSNTEENSSNNVRNENKIIDEFKNLKEKYGLNEDL